MSLRRHAAGLVVALAATAAMAAISQAPVPSGEGTTGTLRLAWRARPERIERCVERHASEVAALPAHMRQTVICDGFAASYRLEVRVDNELVVSDRVMPGGLRRDRPLYVFREIDVAPGIATVDITFTRIEESDTTESGRDLLREAVPPDLRWTADRSFAPGQVRLITYDPQRRALVEITGRSTGASANLPRIPRRGGPP